jgi:dethiobiotin synthetase
MDLLADLLADLLTADYWEAGENARQRDRSQERTMGRFVLERPRMEGEQAGGLGAEAGLAAVDLGQQWQQLQTLQAQHSWVLVEALGGLGTPVDIQTTMADLAWDWRLPTVLVVPVEEDTLAGDTVNAAVAQVALAKQARCPLQGLVLNCAQPVALEAAQRCGVAIAQITRLPILAVLPFLGTTIDRSQGLAAFRQADGLVWLLGGMKQAA